MDLFNPPPNFNYKKMSHKLDTNLLDNPYIQVVWEDYAENITQEKIKSVRHYFQKKYLSTNVNVITKTKTSDETVQTVDISFNVLDKNYQLELMKSFLTNKGNDNLYDEIYKLDGIVDSKLAMNDSEVTPFKRWYIKKIEFSNFLSYGENQVVDFTKCDGITVIESNPPNFGGKTVLSVDLLLFLFFNETTKTSKAEEVFNRFTDKNNDEYIIVRNIERKKSKAGDWNVKTELDFFKKLSDGSLMNFTGEQRRETETFIKNSIGSKEDFLMTILTTATNLEDLIDSKPTARGQVLSRFMGLEFLKRKEDAAKEVFSEFSKSMISNVHNSEQLKTEIENCKNGIQEHKNTIGEKQGELIDVQNRIIKGQEYRDGLLKNKHIDIDKEISMIQPHQVKSEIADLNFKKDVVVKQLSEINVIEPAEYYHEDQHDKVKEEYQNAYKDKVQIITNIDSIQKLKSSVSGGIKCEHCGIELMNAAITQSRISELEKYQFQAEQVNVLLGELQGKEQSFVKLKKDFDEYEKNKLVKEKLEVSIESFDMKIEKLHDKLKKYEEAQDKIQENTKIEEQLLKANMRLEDLENQKTSINNELNRLNFDIEKLNDKIDNNNKIIEKIKQEAEREKIYKVYLEIYGKNGISKIIMKTMMPLINSELQRLLENSCHFRLEIQINEKNEVEFMMVDNNTQVEKLMSSGSGYERTIASLALRAVLSKICSLPKPNIIVFDEVFGKISNDNLEMVSEFFTKIKDYFEKIFVITHNPLVTNWSDNVIRIRKEENISYVSQ